MQLAPRYDTAPVIVLEHAIDEIRVPFLRQRRRLIERLSGLDADQWVRPSRCDDWSVKDVVSHLAGTDAFWTVSVAGAVAGAPTRHLADFDPKATPAAMAAASAATPPGEVLARLIAGTEPLCALVESLEPDQWSSIGEAPPGHVSMGAVVHHALWDCWIHERDIFEPLGQPSPVESDEVTACLRYVVALSPAFGVDADPARSGTLAVEASGPDVSLVVDIADVVRVRTAAATAPDATLAGDAAALVEALTMRGPFPARLAEEHRWMVESLAEIFETDVRETAVSGTAVSGTAVSGTAVSGTGVSGTDAP